MISVRNLPIDRNLYQVILEMLNDKDTNKKTKRVLDEVRYSKKLKKYSMSRAYTFYCACLVPSSPFSSLFKKNELKKANQMLKKVRLHNES